jgi:hypothetical protein
VSSSKNWQPFCPQQYAAPPVVTPHVFVRDKARHRDETTMMLAVPTTSSAYAGITAVPAAWAVTRPAVLTEATGSLEDDHVNILSGTAAPLEVNAFAASWAPSPTLNVSVPGVTTRGLRPVTTTNAIPENLSSYSACSAR